MSEALNNPQSLVCHKTKPKEIKLNLLNTCENYLSRIAEFFKLFFYIDTEFFPVVERKITLRKLSKKSNKY